MTNFLTDIIAAPKRKAVYAVYSIIGLAIGATQAGFGAVAYATPDWLKIFTAVYAFIGTAIGATAASNVGPTPSPPAGGGGQVVG
jgi:Trk-type K+ transport system membrane component